MGDRISEDFSGGEFGGLDDVDGGGGGDGADDMMIDMDLILNILDEPSEPPHNSMEDSMEKTSQADSASQNGYAMLKGKQSRGDAEYSDLVRGYSLYTPEGADSGIGGGSVDYAGNSAAVRVGGDANVELSLLTNSRSFNNRCFPFQEDQGMERVGVLQPENPSCSTVSSFDEGNFDHGMNVADDLHLSLLSGEPGNQLGPLGGQINSHGMKDALSGSWFDHLDQRLEYNGSLPESSYGTSGPKNDTNKPHNVISTQSGSCYNSDVASELGAHHSAMQLGSNAGRTFFVDSQHGHSAVDVRFDLFPNSDVVKTNERDEMAEFLTESACSVSEFCLVDYSILKEMNFKSEGSSYKLPISGNFLLNADDMLMDNQAPVMPFSYNQSGISKNERICIKDEKKHAENAHRGMVWHSFEASNEPTSGNYCCSDETYLFGDENMKQSSSLIFPSTQSRNHAVYTKDEKGDNDVPYTRTQMEGNADVPYTRTQMEGNAGSYHIEDANMNFNGSSQYLPQAKSNIRYNQLTCKIDEGGGKLIQTKGLGSQLSRISPESIESNSSGSKSLVDDDNFELCILEDISQPERRKQSMVPFPSNQSPSTTVPFQHSSNGDSVRSTGVSGMRFRPNDERSIFQAALQDLSQPKSEANPPDGLLAVPLMRHQRIALSWMVQKETSSMHCSGGILADDQGLGKTISTIALILKERPTMRVDTAVVKKEEFETLDLDDDNGDDEVTEMKKVADDIHVIPNRSSTKRMSSVSHSKGRPSAGTLVVCPTSVLRQWADELHKKVTSEANLSVLVYHGSNRTKDPFEVAKYDVVLTTYSIVSMEVPKQPLVDGGDDEKGRRESDDVQHLGLSSGKKRKYPPSSGKKGSNSKKGMDSVLLESTRPLAKVGWFRVVLDEAQCIKNHRTQVARACWGLRAKRRWCLSGTPIQNAIDDLYSYFRFLRYDPYAVYGSFCCTIKLPIQRNPTKGYKKLQAVLKTIMLRRTKGTLLDGKPIINLPPKVIELKKVEFTDEERDFYTKLESDSRDQFKEYAAAGTVKQNYVNILLMLLRLRQACDHRFLVRGIDSNSRGALSIEIAKKLPQEKQISLRNCLEASLAICGICNDPPEDAVVSVCGHVFCNQCICEHLSGEDNQCPTSNCKVRLKVSSVFSKAMLNSFLPHQPGQVSSGPDLVEAVNPYAVDNPYESSKIRAALEVLQSLTKPKDCSSTHSSIENSFYVNAASSDKSSGSADSPTNDVDRGNSVVKVIGEKAIVFSQWTKMLDLLEICLKQSSIKYRRLDGTMSVLDRDNAVKEFNTLPEVSVMIMSLKAASLGLNMVAACRVVLLDLWWNPTTEDQAIDRAHRIGQTRPVTVLRLTVKDTVEDRILALQQKKREMVASAFGEDENGGRQTRLTVEDLSYLFMV